MSGLESLFRKTLSNTSEVSKTQGPSNFADALSEMLTYCEGQLPVLMETEFIPICFDITQDGTLAVIGGRHGNIGTFDMAEKRLIRDEDICKFRAILQVTFAADDTQIAMLNSGFELYFLDFPSYAIALRVELKESPISLKVRPNNDFLYLNLGPEILVFCVDRNDEIDDRRYNERSIAMGINTTCMDISDDGSLIAVGLEDGRLKLIHGDSESELQCTLPYATYATLISFSEHRRHLGAGFADFTLRVWNVDSSLSLKYEFFHHTMEITGIAFARDNRYMISGSKDMNIVIWDMKVERLPYSMSLVDGEVLWFKSSKDHKTLYFSQNLPKFMIWDIPMLHKNARYRKHTDTINKLCFIPHTLEILSIGSDGLMAIWDYRNDLLQEVLQFEGELTNLAMSKTGQFVVLVSSKPCVYTVDLNNYKFDETEIGPDIFAIQLSNDEEMVAISDDFNRIVIYGTKTMDKRFTLKGHLRPVTEIYFLPEDKMILTASLDCTLGKWEISTGNRICIFDGHRTPVTCMILNQDGWVISASEDRKVIIWNIEGVLLYSIQLKDLSKVTGLYLASNHMYLIILQENLCSYWQMYNLSIMFETNPVQPSKYFALSMDELVIAFAEENTIFVEENPLRTQTPRMIGKKVGSTHKYMKFLIDVCKNHSKGNFDQLHNHWVFIPYLISPSHVLSYKNMLNDLNIALFSEINPVSFFSTVNHENPLSICVDLAYKNCIDICLKYLRFDYRRNKRAYMPIESCLTKLNKVDIPGITKLYDTLFQKSAAAHLPLFGLHEAELPALSHSDQFVICPENIMAKELYSTNGRSIVFYQSLCPLDLETGTTGSIDFLESLTECSSDQIFRSKLLQVLLNDKWDKVKWAVYGQGLIYIIYMILLSFFCIYFIDNPEFLILLFIVHVLLFLYEVTQIATDFFDYWGDLWNILDQLRGFSFTIYAVLLWRGDNNMDVLLAVVIFSWTRGISYFRMFDGTRYMVRLLSEVIKDMREFFVILFYSTTAFSFIFYLRSPELSFSLYVTVSYRMDLGSWDADYTALFDWVIFFLATVINLIIMLNLLISIMGDTYAKVQESNDIANYQELTEMIIEIEKLMFWKKRITNKHFLQQCDFLTGEESNNDRALEKVKGLKLQLLAMEKNLNAVKEKIRENNILELEGCVFELKKEQGHMRNEIKKALDRNAELLLKAKKKLGQ